MTVRILHGDALEHLRTLADESVHSIVTDPPYELTAARPGGRSDATRGAVMGGFMGMKWDGTGVAFNTELWTACLRVLKPGGHLLSFGGSRTYHRMACAIEDAGFEIRDQIFWCYGSGFPKSLNVNKALETADAVCRCTEDDVHLQRVSDSDDAIRVADETQQSGDVLLPLQRNSARSGVGNARVERCDRTQELHGIEGRGESCVEGWRHDLQAQGQLCECAVCASARVGAADGAQGRLSHGAPPSDGGMVRLSTDASGDRAPHQSSTHREPANESGTVAGQPQPQDRGAWPICDRCDKPMVTKGLGTALKPAHEPIVVARKPLIGNVAANVLKHGTGAINVDGCRVGTVDSQSRPRGSFPHSDDAWGNGRPDEVSGSHALGRWPANIILDGSDEVLAGFPAGSINEAGVFGRDNNASRNLAYGYGERDVFGYGDSGSAARFFYTAKASRDDRNIGCDELEAKPLNWSSGTQSPGTFQSPNTDRTARNHHPTVKPTDLMQYLVRLVTPPGGTVLDPFAGSGSTGLAADREGFNAILIERDAEYVEIAKRRIRGDCPLFDALEIAA